MNFVQPGRLITITTTVLRQLHEPTSTYEPDSFVGTGKIISTKLFRSKMYITERVAVAHRTHYNIGSNRAYSLLT